MTSLSDARPAPVPETSVPKTPAFGAAAGQPLLLLRLEGGAAFVAALLAYWTLGASWLLFAALILAPDLSMLGYLAGPRVGALAYNLAHTSVAPALLGLFAVTTASTVGLAVATIWVAHIGLDRALGYGLKYPGAFAETHLGRLGRGG